MTSKQRRVFVISNSTAITSETLGHSLMAQFPNQEFKWTTYPYVDSIEKINQSLKEIFELHDPEHGKPMIFSTLADPKVRAHLFESGALVFDPFEAFIRPISEALGVEPSSTAGLSHRISNQRAYEARIEAVNYTLIHDDGAALKHIDQAELIILGVSRTAKTPTSIYLAMHYSIRCANYPLTPDDMVGELLPRFLKPYRDKLVGLTTNPDRLSEIRQERRPDSKYASLQQCRFELQMAENIYMQERIPYVNTESRSIEEISATIIQKMNIERK